MFDIGTILASMGIDFEELETKVKEYATLAREKLDQIDARLARIENALNCDIQEAEFKELPHDDQN